MAIKRITFIPYTNIIVTLGITMLPFEMYLLKSIIELVIIISLYLFFTLKWIRGNETKYKNYELKVEAFITLLLGVLYIVTMVLLSTIDLLPLSIIIGFVMMNLLFVVHMVFVNHK